MVSNASGKVTCMLRVSKVASTLAVLLSVFLYTHSSPSRAAEPVACPAVDGILEAFATHPLVGLGELHMLANELNFYTLVVRDPRFVAKVGARGAHGTCAAPAEHS